MCSESLSSVDCCHLHQSVCMQAYLLHTNELHRRPIFPPRRLRIDTPLPVKQLPNIMSIQDVKTSPHTRPQTASVSIKKRILEIWKNHKRSKKNSQRSSLISSVIPGELQDEEPDVSFIRLFLKNCIVFVYFKCFPVSVNSTVFLSDNIIFETCFFEICFCI